MKLLVESIVVGVITVAIGTIVGVVLDKLVKVSKKINKKYVTFICLFFTGLLIHLICEFTGINKWYCKNGNACKK